MILAITLVQCAVAFFFFCCGILTGIIIVFFAARHWFDEPSKESIGNFHQQRTSAPGKGIARIPYNRGD